jgi:exportin-5
VLATQAKEEQAVKRSDSSKMTVGPRTRVGGGDGPVNADGTLRDENRVAVDARRLLRISTLCHFLFLEDEALAGSITLCIIQCLEYPDAYACRRCIRICHRILETVAWSTRYTPLLANQMFLIATKNIVTEPKWLVGLEWDMINLLRDIYCRLVLGQILQPGGQGPGLQQPKDPSKPMQFEQSKFADRPLQGGGILVAPSELPRQILASLPGMDARAVEELESNLNRKRSAKDQVSNTDLLPRNP